MSQSHSSSASSSLSNSRRAKKATQKSKQKSVQKSVQKTQKSTQKSANKPPNKSAHKSVQKSTKKSVQKSVQNSTQGSTQKSVQKSTQGSTQKSVQNSVKTTVRIPPELLSTENDAQPNGNEKEVHSKDQGSTKRRNYKRIDSANSKKSKKREASASTAVSKSFTQKSKGSTQATAAPPPKPERKLVGVTQEGTQNSMTGPLQSSAQLSLQANVSLGPIQPSQQLVAFWPKAAMRRNHRDRLIFVMRSAERVDRVFGPDWQKVEMPYGWVAPTDQNVSSKIRHVINSGYAIENDPPITEVGRYTSQLVMRCLVQRAAKPVQILCSPALRCIQTACSMASLIEAKICVEPGLFEPLAWYRECDIPLMNYERLADVFPIDQTYEPIVQRSYLNTFSLTETESEGRQRIDQVLRNVMCPRVNCPSGPILIVAHAVTLHTLFFMTKSATADDDDQLTSTEDKWETERDTAIGTEELGIRYPPGCVMSVCRVTDGPPTTFRLINSVVPPLTFGRDFNNRAVHPVV